MHESDVITATTYTTTGQVLSGTLGYQVPTGYVTTGTTTASASNYVWATPARTWTVQYSPTIPTTIDGIVGNWVAVPVNDATFHVSAEEEEELRESDQKIEDLLYGGYDESEEQRPVG